VEEAPPEVDVEATVKAAHRAAKEMADKIQKRRERMEKWRKERQEQVQEEEQGRNWTLDDDAEEEDENDGFNAQEVIQAAKEGRILLI
jgi:ABC-type nitrate/sulfonate/bicarbonate transport system substrate-binding protein